MPDTKQHKKEIDQEMQESPFLQGLQLEEFLSNFEEDIIDVENIDHKQHASLIPTKYSLECIRNKGSLK